MTREAGLLLAADLLLVIHVLFVSFVILGLVLIWAGRLARWHWVGNPWFRLLHLLAIAVVVGQAWLGMICPLTTWEMELRAAAGDTVYAGTFISHWLQSLLYYQAPPWVFTVSYSVFGILVAASLFLVPLRFRRTAE